MMTTEFLAIRVALDWATKEAMQFIGSSEVAATKGSRDFALQADVSIEAGITEILRSHIDVPVVGEETYQASGREPRTFWSVDPIDGTINYSRGLAEFGISVAYVKDASALAGGISFPMLGDRVMAAVGQGAEFNGKRTNSRRATSLNQCVVGFGDFSVGKNSREQNLRQVAMLGRLADKVLRVRMPGTAALQLAWVATGKADVSITLSNNSWDVQAGVLAARESGCAVYDMDGREHSLGSREVIVSSQETKEDLLRVLRA